MAIITVLKIPYGDEEWYRRVSENGLAAIDPIYFEPPDEDPFYILPMEILTWPLMSEETRKIYLDLDTVEIETDGV